MSRKIGFGIIGTGSIAGKHAAAIRELSGAELLAMCSSTKERAAVAEGNFKVKTYSNVDEFLDHPGLDVVCICTASGNHLEPGLSAARKGKHLLIEKPIEITLDRADQLIAACKDARVKLGVIYQNRFNAGFLELKKTVKEGKLGKLLMGNAYVNWFRDAEYYSSSHWKGTHAGDGGGALINQGIHTIDLLVDIMGDVSSVYGKVKTVLYPIEGEDLAASVVNFTSGALGNITGATSLFPGYPERLEIYGTEGSVILEAGEITQLNIKGTQNSQLSGQVGKASGSSDPTAISHEQHMKQFEDMIDAILEDREPIVTGEKARKSLELILAIYRSSKENKPIDLPLK